MIGWLLDTNIISEIARVGGDPRVVGWADAQPEDRLYISVLTLAEFDHGIHNLPIGTPARDRIAAAVALLERRFADRVLAVDNAVVRRWGRISGAVRLATGQPPPVIDALLAATALERDLFLATRKVKDVRATGAAIFNPWIDDPAEFPLAR